MELILCKLFLSTCGFLTALIFMVHAEKEKGSSVILFLKVVILRYVRFAPLLFLIILIHSTWLYLLEIVPVWNKVNIFNYPGWWVLERISHYATFICHIFILKLLMSGIHQPLYLSIFNIVSWPTTSLNDKMRTIQLS